MSVSEIKRQFEKFEIYLGRDTVGLAKLKDLKDAVNVLRTSLAQSEAKTAEHAAAAESLAQRGRELSSERDAAAEELHRLKQVVRNLERDLRVAQAAAVAESEGEADGEGDATDSEMKRVGRRLRKRMGRCPKPTRVSREVDGDGDRVFVYDRESLAEGWSHDAIWNLGASVAVLSAMFGIVVLETARMIRDREPHDANVDSLRAVAQWFRENINCENQGKAGFAKVENVDPDVW